MRLQTEALRKLFFILFPLLFPSFLPPFSSPIHTISVSSFLSHLFLFPSNLSSPPHFFAAIIRPFSLTAFFKFFITSLLSPFLFFLSTFLSNLLNLFPSSLQKVSASSFVHFFLRFLLFDYYRPSFFSFFLCLSSYLH